MGTVVRVPFTVTGGEPEPMELGVGRVTLRKTFSGPLTGSSVVAMTSVAVGESPVGYAAIELVTGTLGGRSGTFVLQHTGVVLPGTGTGEPAGLRGSMTIAPDESGAVPTLDYELP